MACRSIYTIQSVIVADVELARKTANKISDASVSISDRGQVTVMHTARTVASRAEKAFRRMYVAMHIAKQLLSRGVVTSVNLVPSGLVSVQNKRGVYAFVGDTTVTTFLDDVGPLDLGAMSLGGVALTMRTEGHRASAQHAHAHA